MLAKTRPSPLASDLGLGQVVETEHHVLRRNGDRLAVTRATGCCAKRASGRGFDLRFGRQRNVHGHLVAVEVGVERGADQRMDLDRLAFDEHRLKRLDAEAVERRGAVQQDRVVLDDLFEDVPDDRAPAFRPFPWPA